MYADAIAHHAALIQHIFEAGLYQHAKANKTTDWFAIGYTHCMDTQRGVLMGLTWAEHLSVGNDLIDSDHKNLIVVVNSVEHAISTRDRVALSETFELLDNYMLIHFKNEEKVAAAIGFDFAQNKFTHVQLMHDMRYMLNKLENTHIAWPDRLVETYSRFLNSWMTDHIIKTDMKMKPALQSFPYYFKPD